MMQANDPYARSAEQFEEPPRGFLRTLGHLGPGMILVGSIVGSGELIVTTKLGALAGFGLLWFVLFSCLIKVVVQAELARHTISSGKTFLTVFNAIPGPAAPRPVWLTLPWMALVVAVSISLVALFVHLPKPWITWNITAGILSAAVVILLGSAYLIKLRRENTESQTNSESQTTHDPRPRINWVTWLWLASLLLAFVNAGAILGGAGLALELAFPDVAPGASHTWAVVVAVATAALLLSGTYASLEKMFFVMVATFTLMTVLTTILLQWTGYAIAWSDIEAGLSFQTPGSASITLVLAALAMYAGTGVAYGEMKTYTYWCVEKGYSRNVGANQPGEAWARRARGWIRVMYADVLITMVVYTISTVCFYLLGAAVLHANGLNPDGSETLAILGTMYTESLGDWAATLFVVGAFFVLFSTVVAGTAGNSRMMADALAVIGIIDARDYAARLRFIRIFIIVLLVLYLIAYWLFENPPQMLLITSSVIGALMYPILGLGVLYLRHFDVDPRIVPGKLTTVWLWICGLALAIISPAGILLALAIGFGWISIG